MRPNSRFAHLDRRAIANGYRSGLERLVCEALYARGIPDNYERYRIRWIDPAKERKYTPDIVLPSGIIIETKGVFTSADRLKHRHIKDQYPELDIRFVFSNSRAKLNKTAKSTLADWCERFGFLYADRDIPEAWLIEEGPKVKPWDILEDTKGD